MTKAEKLQSANNSIIGNVPEGAEGFAILQIAADNILFITSSDRQMSVLKSRLAFFLPDRNIIDFPAWDILPYDRTSPNNTIISKRIDVLTTLANGMPAGKKNIILTTINAAIQKLPPLEFFKTSAISVQKGQSLPRENLITALVKNGYCRVSKVVEAGEFAVRGSIIDLFPIGYDDGVRIDFFGDEIESLRSFDPLTQISAASLPSFKLLPAGEIILDAESIEKFRSAYLKTFGAVVKEDSLYEAISAGVKFPGTENYLPLFYDKLSSLFDFLPANTAVITDHLFEQNLSERIDLTKDYYDARKANNHKPLKTDALYNLQLEADVNAKNHITLSPLNQSASQNLAFKKISAIGTELEKIKAFSKPVFISCFSQGSLEHIKTLLEKHEIKSKQIINFHETSNTKQVTLFVAPIEEGFENNDFIIISEQDVFGDRFIRTIKKKRKAEHFLAEAAGMQIGELVVHENHGIGKFQGLETVEVGSLKHDMARLVYDGGDRLFVPVENLDVITRYGGGDENTRLDKLGGIAWQERKSKLKHRIKLAAGKLLKIAAERALKVAAKFMPEAGLYDEFLARFPYAETEDQLKAIEEVFDDLAAGKPMDRLICGDVGFGKTEVALRAAFVVAHSGKQVAVVCPTTLLARQHYKTFSERFKGLPIRVAQISRMVPVATAKQNKHDLADGKIDIIIGTHALLAEDIRFKDLGLVVVDEEQHFGVAQKEKLKNLRAEVHVLTLSATPIPRSLQMAMSGVRDLSIIATPPIDRLAVRTFVMPFDELVLREAILRERGRGGRTYYVAPRISDLDELHTKLLKIVPEAKLKIAHGKTSPTELDKIMNQFYDGEFDVLLSTAIVESGLDIPTANTMIIHRADMFGLSQLYQLRGRVGRSKTRAYSYFTTEPRKFMTDNALKRLEVISGLDSLGAGFAVASHDMDIRGFGNLLGDEQSGHVREVGVELYQKMLEEAIGKLRVEGQVQKADSFSPSINIGASVLIPDSYVEDLDLRLGLYKRAASLESADELSAFKIELADRFGRLPQEALQFIEVINLKILCRAAGVEKIDVGPKAVVMQFHKTANIDPQKLLKFVAANAPNIKIRPDDKLVFAKEESEDFNKNSNIVEKYLADIIGL